MKKSFLLISSLVCASFLETHATFGTEIENHMVDKNLIMQTPFCRTFEAKLAPLHQKQVMSDQAERVILHVDNYDIRTIKLLQRPLYDIDLAGEEISLEKLEGLLPIASQVLALNLMESRLQNSSFTLISQLSSLESIILSDNPFDDQAIPYINALINLKHLEIAHTKITGMAFEKLGSLYKLEKLDAGCNILKNIGVINITQKIQSLKYLDVRACGFDATVLPLFLSMPNLKTLNVSNNGIKEEALEVFLSSAKEKGIEVFF